MKILFIAPAGRAGTFQYTHNLANTLAERSHQVAVATGVEFETKSYPRKYHAIEVFDRFRPRPLRILNFLRYLRTVRPQIIHLQGAQHPGIYLVLCTVLRMVTRARFIYSPHDVLPNNMRGYHRRALRLLYKRMCHVFLDARENKRQVIDLFGADPRRITVLPFPDLTAFVRDGTPPRFPDVPNDRKVILCFGLIEPRKGIRTLIRAFPKVSAEIPEAYLFVVGKPYEDLAPYLCEIERLKIGDSVKLIPQYVSFSEMAGFFGRADVVVLPHDTGWISGVLASAYGFGKPVVATMVGGFNEGVEDGKTGFLVPPRDPDALADALIRVLKDDVLREEMAGEVRKASQRYSWSEIARETERIYVSNLSPTTGRPA